MEGIANPLGAALARAMMLDHLGSPATADVLRRAVEKVLTPGGTRTADLDGTARDPRAESCAPLTTGPLALADVTDPKIHAIVAVPRLIAFIPRGGRKLGPGLSTADCGIILFSRGTDATTRRRGTSSPVMPDDALPGSWDPLPA